MKKYADPGKVRLFSIYKLYSDSSVFNGAVNNGFKRVVQEVNESIKNEIKETKNKQEKEKLRGGAADPGRHEGLFCPAFMGHDSKKRVKYLEG